MSKGTWLHTKEGDLDPLWIFLCVYLLLGVVAVLVAASKGGVAAAAALGFLAFVILALAIIKVPVDRARLLANSKTLAQVADSISPASFVPHEWADGQEDGVL